MFSCRGIAHIANYALANLKPLKLSISAYKEKVLCDQLDEEVKKMKKLDTSEKIKGLPSKRHVFFFHPVINVVLSAFLGLLFLSSVLFAIKLAGLLIVELLSKHSGIWFAFYEFFGQFSLFQNNLLKLQDFHYFRVMKELFSSLNEFLDYIVFA